MTAQRRQHPDRALTAVQVRQIASISKSGVALERLSSAPDLCPTVRQFSSPRLSKTDIQNGCPLLQTPSRRQLCAGRLRGTQLLTRVACLGAAGRESLLQRFIANLSRSSDFKIFSLSQAGWALIGSGPSSKKHIAIKASTVALRVIKPLTSSFLTIRRSNPGPDGFFEPAD